MSFYNKVTGVFHFILRKKQSIFCHETSDHTSEKLIYISCLTYHVSIFQTRFFLENQNLSGNLGICY